MLDRDRFTNTPARLLAEHRSRLLSLVGSSLEATWVAWDTEDDTWFDDEAVILQIGGQRLEIVCFKMNEIALTWNEIDLDSPPASVSDWSFELSWRRNGHPVLREAVGAVVEAVSVIEHLFTWEFPPSGRRQPEPVGAKSSCWLLHGLEFRHSQGVLQVFNALDRNGVADKAPAESTHGSFRYVTL